MLDKGSSFWLIWVTDRRNNRGVAARNAHLFSPHPCSQFSTTKSLQKNLAWTRRVLCDGCSSGAPHCPHCPHRPGPQINDLLQREHPTSTRVFARAGTGPGPGPGPGAGAGAAERSQRTVEPRTSRSSNCLPASNWKKKKKKCQPLGNWTFSLAAIQTCAYILVSNMKTRRYTPDPRWSAVGIKEAEPFKVDDCGNLPRGVWRWRLTLRSWVRQYQTGSRWVSLRGAHLWMRVDQGQRPPPEKFQKCRCNFPHSVAFLWVSKM